MNKIKQLIAVFAILLGFGTVGLVPVSASAVNPVTQIQDGVTAAGSTGKENLGKSIKKVVNVLLFVLGIIAVIVIVIAGIRYATSGGDSAQITGAKNTILYAVVGLVVAILAYAIVNFVLGAFK